MAKSALDYSPPCLEVMPHSWHPLSLTPTTKKSLMASFSHNENFSYDDRRGFLVEVPNAWGHSKVERAAISILKDHVEVDIKLTRGGSLSTCQPRRPDNQCYSWWLGQLIHYGLQLELSADEAKALVRSCMLQGALSVPKNLKVMEQRMRRAANRRAANRRAKKCKARLIAGSALFNNSNGRPKIKSDGSDVDDDREAVQNSASRRRVQPLLKVEDQSSSEHRFHSSGDSDRSSTIETVPTTRQVVNKGRKQTTDHAAIFRPLILQTPKIQAAARQNSPDYSTDSSSFSEIDVKNKAREHHAPRTQPKLETSFRRSDYDDSKILRVPARTADSASDTDGIFGDAEYERAVIANSQSVYGNSAMYDETDPSGSSSDDETTSAPKQLNIKRDVSPYLEGLEQMSEMESTPTPTPSRSLKYRADFEGDIFKNTSKRQTQTEARKGQELSTKVHAGMTLDDIVDPDIHHKVQKISQLFPNESVYLCYSSLAKHNGQYEEACQELVNFTSTLVKVKTPKQSLRARTVPTQKQVFSRGTSKDPFTLSDDDEPDLPVQEEPTRKRQSDLKLGKLRKLISDDTHGSHIDLTNIEDDKLPSTCRTANQYRRSRSRKRKREKQLSPVDIPKKILRAVAVETPSSAYSSQVSEKLKQRDEFLSSPPVSFGLKGILKPAPSFRSRDSLLNRALDSSDPPSRESSTRLSYDFSSQPERKSSPELPPHPPARKPQFDSRNSCAQEPKPASKKKQQQVVSQQRGPQYFVSSNPYMTKSRINAFHDQPMIQPAQIEEVAQPESLRSFFSPAPDRTRILGLSRQHGDDPLQRETVTNTGVFNRVPAKRKHRQEEF